MEPETEGLDFYFDAFREIGTSRSGGLDLQPIPFTAIADYFRIYEIPGDYDEFAYIIRRLDDVFLDMSARANKKEKDGNTNKNDKDKRRRTGG